MDTFFIRIYNFFYNRKPLLYSLMTGSILVLSFFAVKVNFDEDVTSFFPDGKDNQKTALVFKNLKVKDKIIILFSAADTSKTVDPDRFIEASEAFVGKLKKSAAAPLIKDVVTEVDASAMNQVTDFIYANLPIYLTDKDYSKLDSLTTPEAIKHKMQTNYENLISPMGVALKDIVVKDPIGLGNSALSGLKVFGEAANYTMYDGYIFSEDMSKMLVLIDPVNGTGSTGKNEALISSIEEQAKTVMQQMPEVSVEHYGGPSVAVYNARQIKRDTMITLTIAILIIVVFISLAFRNWWAMLLISLPVLFGGIFALALIYFINGSISSIAIGAGAAVFGIAMSYSIHVLSHREHTKTIPQVIEELAYPLTIGSFTTIGAFLGLLFTNSKLLRDFGLFAALSLIGTTIFCLVFLPHMLSEKKRERKSKLLEWIERANSYRYDSNKWLIGFIVILVGVCFFWYNDVRFDSDMMHLNYESDALKKTEQKINSIYNGTSKKVLFVSACKSNDSLLTAYANINKKLALLQLEGKIEKSLSAQQYLVPVEVQKERIEKWNRFWTKERRDRVCALVDANAAALQFAPGCFIGFKNILDKDYHTISFSAKELAASPLFKDWASSADSLSMLITQVTVKNKYKDDVYRQLKSEKDLVIVDRSYFAQKMAASINSDFNLILVICSVLVFLALLLSYGRLELAIMSFIPMAISWIIILGLMAILGIEFNIVNIILSTFVFGIGDDFSIFIMDGLLNEYKTGKKMLSSHKTAIFFSAFTTVVGMGALVFAGHPALQSISMISLLGMVAVVLISYTVQPIIFRIFITLQVKRGGLPYTILGIARSLFAYVFFLFGCLMLQLQMMISWIIPASTKRKKYWFHVSVSLATRAVVNVMFMVRKVRINKHGEDFKTPAVIVANHQSFIDILVLLGLNPKTVMVTNGWVWNSPFFGRIVRYADFYHTANGYEALADSLKEKIADGYSVVVFPEGTRSVDGSIKRFHKGAFYLAETLKLDLLPIVLYGNGMVISKKQPFFIKKGTIVTDIMERIPCGDSQFGSGYKENAKGIGKLVRAEYSRLCDEFGKADNPYFFEALTNSYTFKGPVLEWYMKVKVRMEKRYRVFDGLIPNDATITDIGCGYGPLCFMLSMYSPKRTILGIDYDEEKIAVANHNFLKTDKLTFVCSNAIEYELPQSDIFILNDVLHYMGMDAQEALIKKCISLLNPGGKIIIRDGDASKQEKHKVTKLTETLSTEVFKFNKTEGALCFTSSEQIEIITKSSGLEITLMDNDVHTSNTIYILQKI
ncbi:MMPL family transporter [uncultured Acetobacteroides sp.]|uniref:MMPL family transporter n=1 Tax=uncultured Acetobacteroides sp. TaxID=1760811 RepID=UPI0029F513DD|nr:MMPL family transporter [uncultured Acetobacteroides sp.]